ncbi:hypothetical protein [uncultured Microbacterium sp.]|uniref:hypothetical protein n=1 Tax=Microbacterium algeriense TaxID=2615184 RepID=UPI002593F79E|nr:hypothetical protein [uncultured Microbacterium sp.]
MALTNLNNELNKFRDTASKIRSDFTTDVDALNANDKLSMAGKRAELDQREPEYRAKLTELSNRETAALENTRQALRRQITGTATDGDVIAFRDAHDRAATLKTAHDARDAMTRALDVGDQALAKAILDTAIGKGWDDVVTSYTSANPDMATTINDLYDLHRWTDNVQNEFERSMAYQLPDARLREVHEGPVA